VAVVVVAVAAGMAVVVAAAATAAVAARADRSPLLRAPALFAAVLPLTAPEHAG